MKNIVVSFLIVGFCFGNNTMSKKLESIKATLQSKYNIHSLEDLKRASAQNRSSNRTAQREMVDLFGEWSKVEQKLLFHVTVDTDQNVMNPMSVMGMVEAEGSVNASTADYTEVLKYLLDQEQLDDMFEDSDESCEPCDGADGCGNYYEEGECIAMDGCDWYGNNGSGCASCEPCGGVDGCGGYMLEGECIAMDGCDWYGWQDGSGCSGDNYRSRTHGDTLIFEYRQGMNYARYGAAYATDGQYIYAINGAEYDAAGDSTIYHKHGERYSPSTDTWEMFGDSLPQRRYTVAEYANGNIYVFNGNYSSNSVDIISTSDGTVTTSETNPFPVVYGGSGAWEEKIYLFGGSYYEEDSLIYSNRLYVFDPQDESWTRLSDMPVAANTNGAVVDGVLYTFGGYNGSVLSDINAYDISTDSWQTVGQMPFQISAHSVATDGTYLYVLGDYISNMNFSGVYDPSDNEFYDKTSNMDGRRHSSAVSLGGLVYVYGGTQPQGYNDNVEYTTLSSLQVGELQDNDEDEEPGVLIMNITFMDFFGLLFGMTPDDLGVNNPIILGVTSEQLDNGEVVISQVQGAVFTENGSEEYESIPSEAIISSTIDTNLYILSFDNLDLYDSTGASVMSLTGTIGPSMWNFVAGVETQIDMAGGLMGDDTQEEHNIFLYEDSTGMEIKTEYDDYYYYYEEPTDTSYFTWHATDDSLHIYFDPDEYGDSDSLLLKYLTENDSLYLSGLTYPCNVSPYYNEEDCLAALSDEVGLGALEGIQHFGMENKLVFVSEEYYVNVDLQSVNLPENFKLYSNYPNPFNPVTTIRFDVGINSGDKTFLNIYNIAGRNISTLIQDNLSAGTYEVHWNSGDLASGVYFYELVSGSYRKTMKMILLK